MAIVDNGRQHSYRHRHRAEQRDAWLLSGVAYPLCLLVAAARRLAAMGPAQHRQSVFAEARAIAGSVIPFAFR